MKVALIASAVATTLCARILFRSLLGLTMLASCTLAGLTHPQYCNPAAVSYIVRDESGKALNGAALQSIFAQLPKSIGDARVSVGESSFAGDGKTFYWQDSVDWSKGVKVESLHFSNVETCTMRLTEVTLTYKNKKMRLMFNLAITREQEDRRPVIESLPFQEGTFALDLNGWSPDPTRVIPSERWKRVKDQDR